MKKSILAICLATLSLAFWLAATPVAAAEVSQGKCIRFDETDHTITIEAYDIQFSKDHPYGRPTGGTETFDVSTAAIGIHPEAGDILRLAWIENGDRRTAFKVMNVSKQDLRKK